MDKRVILAVAGSGKTRYIVENLNLEARSLVITYTINNRNNISECIIKKFGYFPQNIRLYTYFSFLNSFCYRPYLALKLKSSGITYKQNPNFYIKQSDIDHFFLDKSRRVYANRIAKLLEIQGLQLEINNRIEKYFDNIFIDEVQDFAGNDFNFLVSFYKTKLDTIAVGDFYQHTFDTSRDGSVNKNLHSDYLNYIGLFKKSGITVDTSSLKASYRCSPSICTFINDNVGIKITAFKSMDSTVFTIDSQEKATEIFENQNIIKLFYQTHYKYDCFSRNWGDCKGENKYYDVCVVLNKTTKDAFPEKLRDLSPQTKNKLYVACTRANNDLYFVPEYYYENFKKMNI